MRSLSAELRGAPRRRADSRFGGGGGTSTCVADGGAAAAAFGADGAADGADAADGPCAGTSAGRRGGGLVASSAPLPTSPSPSRSTPEAFSSALSRSFSAEEPCGFRTGFAAADGPLPAGGITLGLVAKAWLHGSSRRPALPIGGEGGGGDWACGMGIEGPGCSKGAAAGAPSSPGVCDGFTLVFRRIMPNGDAAAGDGAAARGGAPPTLRRPLNGDGLSLSSTRLGFRAAVVSSTDNGCEAGEYVVGAWWLAGRVPAGVMLPSISGVPPLCGFSDVSDVFL